LIPDHADLDVELELPGRATVAGEDGRAVGVGVGVDEREAILVGVGPHDAQHRTEDLVGVDGHLRLDVVEPAVVPRKKAVGGNVAGSTVDDDAGSGFRPPR